MKPLQPILDLLERTDNPRARVLEALKPKPVQPTTGSTFGIFGQACMNELMRQGLGNLDPRQQRQYFGMQQAAQNQPTRLLVGYTITTSTAVGIVGGGR